jgi:chitodextrinase
MKAFIHSAVFAVAAALAASACTLKNADAPPLSGPSEFGTSITIEVNPDILPTDGGSQARVTVTARDPNGEPLANRTLRAEILVDGVATDFGTLSARSVVTNAQGQATFVYTAPNVNGGSGAGGQVAIAVTPLGTDAASSVQRIAMIRLIPPGVVIGPAGLTPQFTMTPPAPALFDTVFFDATASTSSPINPIVSYRWDFADGQVLFGPQVSRSFSTLGEQPVRLTIFDALGRSASVTHTVQVSTTLVINAGMTISPADPAVGEEVFFNGASSTAPPGRRIVRYVWNFGNGETAEGITASTRYSAARTYNPTLTITDDVGRTDTEVGQVSVK